MIVLEEHIVLDERTVGVWYMKTLDTQDWMGAILEVKPNEEYLITYRFRYYNDNVAFNSSDHKSWYMARCKATTRHYAIASIRFVLKELKHAGAIGEMYELLNDNGLEEFERRFMNAPFAFAKMHSPSQRGRGEK